MSRRLSLTVAHLPADSVIYFLTFGEGGAGAKFRSTDVGERLSPLANAPICSWIEVGMDHRIVGGRLSSNEIVATRSAVHCVQFGKLHAIPISYRADDDLGHVEAELALCLYRIAQEALRNVAKHADARHVGVTLSRTADGVELSIDDDGKGFDLGATRARGAGLGLVSIDERVRLVGGSVDVETQPRSGTRVRVHIPLAQPMPLEHAQPFATTA